MGDLHLRKIIIVDEQGLLNSNIIKSISSAFTIHYCEEMKTLPKFALASKTKLILLTFSIESDFQFFLSIVRQLKINPQITLLVLSDTVEEAYQIEAFEAGVMDWISISSSPIFIRHRILKNFEKQSETDKEVSMKAIRFNNLVIDHERYEIELEGNRLSIPRKEFEILSLLTSKPGKVFRRTEIITHVWKNESNVRDRTIDVHIRMLREILEKPYIVTVKGVGYKFIPQN